MGLAREKNEFEVRLASKKDGEKIHGLIQKAFANYNKGEINPALRESLLDVYRDIEENIVLVVEYDGEIIGSLRLELRKKHSYYLKRFAILPEYQHRGIGTMLFKYAAKTALKHQGKYIYLHSSIENVRLVKFYKKLGFNCQEIDNENGYQRGLWVRELNN